MKSKAYLIWIATLDDTTRDLVQAVMAFVGAQIDDRFNELAEDIARVERRQGKNSGRVDQLQLRLDQYEKQQWSAAKEAIEQFAATQLRPEQRDELIEAFHGVVRDVEELKAARSAGRCVRHRDTAPDRRHPAPDRRAARGTAR
jgi:hypothetical protein